MDLMIETRNAEADYLNAKLAREVAKIELKEYVEGTQSRNWPSPRARSSWRRAEVERSSEIPRRPRSVWPGSCAAADNSAFGLNIVYTYTDRVASG